MGFKCTFIPKGELVIGHRTVLGVVTGIEVSGSGKTMLVTVDSGDGSEPFTDRISADGKIAVFTEE